MNVNALKRYILGKYVKSWEVILQKFEIIAND